MPAAPRNPPGKPPRRSLPLGRPPGTAHVYFFFKASITLCLFTLAALACQLLLAR